MLTKGGKRSEVQMGTGFLLRVMKISIIRSDSCTTL